jgi:histone deacetylase 1/2
MENANSKDYLEKIKIQVIENLRQTAHAPSVQMTDVPRTTITGVADDEDDILDDLDADENKDVRMTKRAWDQKITRDDELEESDEEEEAYANGVRPQNGANKRRNIMDYRNSNAVASDVDMDSGVATPEPQVDAIATALATEANAEVNAEVMEQKSRSLTTAAEAGEVGPSNAPSRADTPKEAILDHEGDVEMAEDTPAPAPGPVEPQLQVPTPSIETPLSPAASPPPAVLPSTEPTVEAPPTIATVRTVKSESVKRESVKRESVKRESTDFSDFSFSDLLNQN